jgi:hypothetical protein
LISFVNGADNISTHDLSNFVGIQSRRHVESEHLETRAVTSSTVAGANDGKSGGLSGGSEKGLIVGAGNCEINLVILVLKNFRNDVVMSARDSKVGSEVTTWRPKILSIVDQRLRGLSLYLVIKFLK